jgi:hypothetical protein
VRAGTGHERADTWRGCGQRPVTCACFNRRELLPNHASDRFGSSRLVGDLEEELQSFVEIRTERHIDHGLSPEVAQRTGFLELGGMEPVKERVRDGRSVS